MVPSLLTVLGFTAVPVVASLVGGLIAAFWPPNAAVRGGVQHFAAGVVFAAAALELLPKVKAQSPLVAVVGFAVGVAAMLLLRAVTRRVEDGQGGDKGGAAGLAVVSGVDILIDGLIVGAGFASGGSTGALLAIALTLEFLFLGLAVAAELGRGTPRWRIVGLPTALGLIEVVGGVVGYLALGGVSAAVLAGVLAFGAVALMYLVTEELLVEAHEAEDTPWAVALFFVGFLAYLVIEELV